MLPAQILRAKPRLMLLQNANTLFFAETAPLHRLSPQLENRLTLYARLFRAAGQHLAGSLILTAPWQGLFDGLLVLEQSQ